MKTEAIRCQKAISRDCLARVYALDLTISISGTGLGLNGEEIEVSLNLPVRITYYPSDIIANPIPEMTLKSLE